ncbi:MFS transporter [Candidatus Bathyarchaeota archaeon]|nr:MFS transporter [Candidatus Bathyarchaeota archaeon]
MALPTTFEGFEMVERSRTSDILSIYVPSFFIFVGMGIVSPVLTIYAKSFGVSIFLASMAITIYSVGRLIMDFPAGLLADKIGRKPLMVAGSILLTITALLNATTDNFWLFLFYRFVQGVGSSMWMTSRTTLLADILKPEERGRVLGYFQSFQTIGQAAGPTIGGFVASWWGIKANFYFLGLTGLISLVLTQVFIRETSVGKEHKGEFAFPKDLMLRLIDNKGFIFAALASSTAFFTMSGIRQTILPIYATQVANLSPADIGMILSVAMVANLFLTIPIGYGIDLLGRKPVVVASLAIYGLSMFLFPQVSTFLLLCLISLIMGVGSSGAQQAPLAMATDSTINEPRGVSMGMFRFFGDIGSLLGPLILGIVADGFNLAMPFYIMGIIILTNSCLIFFFGEETLPNKKVKVIKEKVT